MVRVLVLVALVLSLVWFGPVVAADGPAVTATSTRSDVKIWRYNKHPEALPFERSERAASVWASGACWNDCGSYCAWGMAGCLERDSQGQCLKLTDKCDRYCQRQCRTSGGPLLPIELPWD